MQHNQLTITEERSEEPSNVNKERTSKNNNGRIHSRESVIIQAQKFIDDMHAPDKQTTFGYQFYKHMRVEHVEFPEGSVGKVYISFKMQPHFRNSLGIQNVLWAVATLCDTIPYVAIHGFDSRKLVTAKLVTDFLNPTPVEGDLMMESVIHKMGLKNAYADFTLTNPKTREILAKGTGIFAFVEMPPKL